MTYHDQFLEDSLSLSVDLEVGQTQLSKVCQLVIRFIHFFVDSADSKSIDFSVACCQTPN